jgi:hypothetical protein
MNTITIIAIASVTTSRATKKIYCYEKQERCYKVNSCFHADGPINPNNTSPMKPVTNAKAMLFHLTVLLVARFGSIAVRT